MPFCSCKEFFDFRSLWHFNADAYKHCPKCYNAMLRRWWQEFVTGEARKMAAEDLNA